MLYAYQQDAARTANTTKPYPIRLAAAAMGLSGEAAEVLAHLNAESNVLIKELGDCMWYVAEVATLTGIDLETLDAPRPEASTTHTEDAIALVIQCGAITDFIKKVVGHDHAMDVPRIGAGLAEVLPILARLSAFAGTTLTEVCAKNVAKLKARYPEGFSSERSINRAE